MNFKIVFMLGAALLLLASGANAAVVCGGAQDVTAPGFACDFSNHTFSNFAVVNAGNNPNPKMFLVTANLVGNEMVLNFNPSMSVSNGGLQDTWFYFQVTGGTTGFDLGVGGTGASITERVCSTPIDVNSGNICTGGIGNQLGALSQTSGTSSGFVPYSTPGVAETVFIFKNILLQSPGQGVAVELSAMSQSFGVPEPVTFILFGSGLLGLGIWRRRSH